MKGVKNVHLVREMGEQGFSKGEEARIGGEGRKSRVLKGGGEANFVFGMGERGLNLGCIAGFGRSAEKQDLEFGQESKFREVVLIGEYRRVQRA